MLATLTASENPKQDIKDDERANDPHDRLDISPDVVLAARSEKHAPALVPDAADRPEPKIRVARDLAAALAFDTNFRATASDVPAQEKRGSFGTWLGRVLFTVLFAAGSAAGAVAWQSHGDAAKAIIAAWTPSMPSFGFGASPSPAPAATEAAAPEPQTAPAAEPAVQAAATAEPQQGAAANAASAASDASETLQSMARDLAAMGQQLQDLRANITELKAGQEQMTREIAKAQPKPVDTKPAHPTVHPKVSALPPHPPAHKPAPKRVYTRAYAPAPAPIDARSPPQAAAVPPPPELASDGNGPVVRPPMPLR